MKTNKLNGRAKINIRPRSEEVVTRLPKSLSDDDLFLYNLSKLDCSFPEKLLFSIKEAANVLNVSDDFVSNRIRAGKLRATKLGDRSMINKLTLANIITQGV
jgi:excisionase family DNA binding protein